MSRDASEETERLVIHLANGKKQSPPLAIWSEKTWQWNYEKINRMLSEYPKIKSVEFQVKQWNQNEKACEFPQMIKFNLCSNMEEVKMTCFERMKFRQLPNWMRAEEICFNPQVKKGEINVEDITSLVVRTFKIESSNVSEEFINGMKAICDQIRILKEIDITFKNIADGYVR